MIVRFWLVILAALGTFGCSSCVNGAPSPAVVPSVNLAVCIFDQYATAPACRPTGNWVACVEGIAVSCGADVASVGQVLGAHRRAMIADGFVVAPVGDP